MPVFYAPGGNPEIWDEKPPDYYTVDEWDALPKPDPPTGPVLKYSSEEKYQFLEGLMDGLGYVQRES